MKKVISPKLFLGMLCLLLLMFWSCESHCKIPMYLMTIIALAMFLTNPRGIIKGIREYKIPSDGQIANLLFLLFQAFILAWITQ